MALALIKGELAPRKYVPSLATLPKYAKAVGCQLEFRMVPRW
jgi:hypothetical protein